MHDVFIVSVPLIIILAGILLNRADTKELRAEMKDLRAEMQKRFDQTDAHLARIDADLRQFYHLTGKLEGRTDNIEKYQ